MLNSITNLITDKLNLETKLEKNIEKNIEKKLETKLDESIIKILEQNKGLKRNTIDKYYTKINIVELCINLIKTHIIILENDLIIEPCAGDGVFITNIKQLTNKYKFYNLEPEHIEIHKQDFLELEYNDLLEKYNNIHIIGNPPFGRQASMAIKFIKKCCLFSY